MGRRRGRPLQEDEHKEPQLRRVLPFDSKATNWKNAFVVLWNPMAKKDGLPTRQSGDL